MNKQLFIHGIILIFLQPLQVLADQNLAERYVKNYVAQVRPEITKMLLKAEPGLSNHEVEAKVNSTANLMARCQLKAVAHYPAVYKAASVEPVAEGKDIREVTQNVNQLVRDDIQSGKISISEFKSLVERGASIFKACMS